MDLKVAQTTVQSRAAEKLREAILTGLFEPGEKLSEPALCRALAVSRTSVREALRSLAAERLITIVPNRGPSVAEIGWPEAAAIYQLRALLEGEAMALLARCATPSDTAAMAAALAAFAKAVRRDDAAERVASTARFYKVILGRCGNPVLAELAEGLLARVSYLRARSMSVPNRPGESLREMQAMLDAILAGNVRAARATAIAHVKAARAAARLVMAGTGAGGGAGGGQPRRLLT